MSQLTPISLLGWSIKFSSASWPSRDTLTVFSPYSSSARRILMIKVIKSHCNQSFRHWTIKLYLKMRRRCSYIPRWGIGWPGMSCPPGTRPWGKHGTSVAPSPPRCRPRSGPPRRSAVGWRGSLCPTDTWRSWRVTETLSGTCHASASLASVTRRIPSETRPGK